MTEEAYNSIDHRVRHSVPDHMIHPKHCRGCDRIWELESQKTHKCTYCGHRLHARPKLGLTQFATYFIPVLAFIAVGFLLLHIMGRHYHG